MCPLLILVTGRSYGAVYIRLLTVLILGLAVMCCFMWFRLEHFQIHSQLFVGFLCTKMGRKQMQLQHDRERGVRQRFRALAEQALSLTENLQLVKKAVLYTGYHSASKLNFQNIWWQQVFSISGCLTR